jgi:hypothetical protein
LVEDELEREREQEEKKIKIEKMSTKAVQILNYTGRNMGEM